MGLPLRTPWVDHLPYYQEPALKIPETYSWKSLAELKKEMYSKAKGDPRRDFLWEVWIPFIGHKRWELAWWRKEDLAELDREADGAAADVRDRVSRVRQRLPIGVDEPTIAKVEADATALQVTPQRHRLAMFRRQFRSTRHCRHSDRSTKNFRAYEFTIKLTLSLWTVGFSENCHHIIRTSDGNTIAALLPQHKFHQSIKIFNSIRCVSRFCGKQSTRPMKTSAIIATERQSDWSPALRSFYLVSTIP
jgi:hypothetical protein